MLTLPEVARRFENARQQGNGYMARCPAHDDGKASLSISTGDGGKILLHCHAGCEFAAITKAAGLNMADVQPENGNGQHRNNGKAKKAVALYVYHDENGKPLFRKIRYEPKGFSLQRCVGPDKWEYGIASVRRVLYRLPQILRSDPEQWVYIVEGEKDVDRAEKLGMLATCNFDGAAKSGDKPKWREEYNEHLRGRNIVIIPDNDEAGRAHAAAIAKSLHGTAASIRVLCLPGVPEGGGDLTDWTNAGGTDEQLGELTEACQLWQPGDEPAAAESSDKPTLESPIDICDLIAQHPTLPDPLIHRLIRRGETGNIISSSKIGKSWMAYEFAFCVATGRKLWGEFLPVPGKVLILDNELHNGVIADRLARVAKALDIAEDDYRGRIAVRTLRGKNIDVRKLASYIAPFEPGQFSLVILDALYRAIPADVDENSNSEMTQVYNLLDSYAAKLDSAWLNVHHSSKGNQSGKSVTDVGAGAGAISRAVDLHLAVRPHAENGVVVVEGAVRSWQPIEPLCLRWEFPRWLPATDMDPSQLRMEKPRQAKRDSGDDAQPTKFEERMAKVRTVLAGGPMTKNAIKTATKMNTQNVNEALDGLVEFGEVEIHRIENRNGFLDGYRLAEENPGQPRTTPDCPTLSTVDRQSGPIGASCPV